MLQESRRARELVVESIKLCLLLPSRTNQKRKGMCPQTGEWSCFALSPFFQSVLQSVLRSSASCSTPSTPTCCSSDAKARALSLRSILPAGLQHNSPLAIMELHRDELPELDLLVSSLLEGKARKKIGRDCAHLCVCEAGHAC